MTLLLGLVLALAAVFVVVLPILRPPSDAPKPSILFDDPEDDPREHRKALALAALKEIEFDRETGKLSEDDYQAMLARYTKEAVEALKAAEAPAVAPAPDAAAGAPEAEAVPAEPALAMAGSNGSGGNGHAPSREGAAEDAVERLIAETRKAIRGRKFCTSCGAPLEGSGRFCVECGARA